MITVDAFDFETITAPGQNVVRHVCYVEDRATGTLICQFHGADEDMAQLNAMEAFKLLGMQFGQPDLWQSAYDKLTGAVE